MASMNRVFLMGNLTRDPEVSSTSSGRKIAKLGLAVSRKYQTADKQVKEEVCFVNVVVWGKQAEPCGQYLKKGRPVLVEGRLHFREWETDSGQKRNALDVVAERVQFLGTGQKGAAGGGEAGEGSAGESRGSAAGQGNAAPQADQPRAEDIPQVGDSADADDLPF